MAVGEMRRFDRNQNLQRVTSQFSALLLFIRNGNEISNKMPSTMNPYHRRKCGMGFDTEEELEQHDYDVHVRPLLLTTV